MTFFYEITRHADKDNKQEHCKMNDGVAVTFERISYFIPKCPFLDNEKNLINTEMAMKISIFIILLMTCVM